MMDEQPDEQPRTSEEEEAERIAEQQAELLERVRQAAANKLPEPPKLDLKRPEPPKQPDSGSSIVSRGSGLAIGAMYALFAPTLGGILIGWLADSRLNSGPTWLMVGFFVGFLAGMVMFIRLVSQMNREDGK